MITFITRIKHKNISSMRSERCYSLNDVYMNLLQCLTFMYNENTTDLLDGHSIDMYVYKPPSLETLGQNSYILMP